MHIVHSLGVVERFTASLGKGSTVCFAWMHASHVLDGTLSVSISSSLANLFLYSVSNLVIPRCPKHRRHSSQVNSLGFATFARSIGCVVVIAVSMYNLSFLCPLPTSLFFLSHNLHVPSQSSLVGSLTAASLLPPHNQRRRRAD